MEYLNPFYSIAFARITHKDVLHSIILFGLSGALLSAIATSVVPIMWVLTVLSLWLVYTPNVLLFLARKY